LPEPLPGRLADGELPWLVVDERRQLLRGVRVAPLDRPEDAGHVREKGGGHNPWANPHSRQETVAARG
jgi:hypothetical protein